MSVFEVVGMSPEDQAAWQAALGVPGNIVVDVSSAQIKALNASPVELVPAPGANKIIVPVSAVGFLSFGTTQYTVGGGEAVISYPGVFGSMMSFGNLIVASGNLISARSVSAFADFDGSIINQPLVLTNQSADYADGDGTLKVLVTYNIVDLS